MREKAKVKKRSFRYHIIYLFHSHTLSIAFSYLSFSINYWNCVFPFPDIFLIMSVYIAVIFCCCFFFIATYQFEILNRFSVSTFTLSSITLLIDFLDVLRILCTVNSKFFWKKTNRNGLYIQTRVQIFILQDVYFRHKIQGHCSLMGWGSFGILN